MAVGFPVADAASAGLASATNAAATGAVSSTGNIVGGGGNVVVHQNFNFSANGDDSVKKIIAQAAPQIANMTQKQIMDARRRGGAMKSTFG